jgi:hypothetical protein
MWEQRGSGHERGAGQGSNIVFMQGPPLDTQVKEWEKAANEIYEIIAPTLSMSPSQSETP